MRKRAGPSWKQALNLLPVGEARARTDIEIALAEVNQWLAGDVEHRSHVTAAELNLARTDQASRRSDAEGAASARLAVMRVVWFWMLAGVMFAACEHDQPLQTAASVPQHSACPR
jgi:hypothetical protein